MVLRRWESDTRKFGLSIDHRTEISVRWSIYIINFVDKPNFRVKLEWHHVKDKKQTNDVFSENLTSIFFFWASHPLRNNVSSKSCCPQLLIFHINVCSNVSCCFPNTLNSVLLNLEELPPNSSNPFLWLPPSAGVITGATTLGQRGPGCTEGKGIIPFYP